MSHLPKTDDEASAGIPLRKEIPAEDTWDLTPLYADAAAWEKDFARLQEIYPRIANCRGKLGDGMAPVLEALGIEKSTGMLAEKLTQYASLKVSEDGADDEALTREARLEGVLIRVGEAFSFLSPELQALDEAAFGKLLEAPELEDWRISLLRLRRMKPHTLTAPEERLMALGSAAMASQGEIFSQLTNVDMRFGTVMDEDGTRKEITQSSLSSFLMRRSPQVRKEAFHSFYEEIESHRYTLAASLAGSVKADVFRARARNFSSAREASLFGDDVPVEVYDGLTRSVRARLPQLHAYYELRRKALGLEEIHHYDTYVPMIAEAQTRIPWDEAVALVLEALKPLGQEYTQTLEAGLRKERWCDRYENKGKRSGAFSYGTFSGPPYILMNYKPDVFSDVFTLAHEAGHSMHTWYSRRAQRFQNYHYPIFLAEVASTFNEILLTEYLLAKTEDPLQRAMILNRQIDDFRGTLFRQTMFAEFESDIHAAEEAGEGLTLDFFRKAYRSLLDAYFGSRFSVDDVLELECLRIPHFYSAFYVYKYATGLSAAAALADHVLRTGETDRYLTFLSSGGSKFPIETLADAGVDMLGPGPVDAALDIFGRRVAELEGLLSA